MTRPRFRVGRRHIDKMGMELIQMVTYAGKDDFENANRVYEDYCQMLDDVLQTSGMQAYLDERAKPKKKATPKKKDTPKKKAAPKVETTEEDFFDIEEE